MSSSIVNSRNGPAPHQAARMDAFGVPLPVEGRLALGRVPLRLITFGTLFCGFYTQIEGRVYVGDALFLVGAIMMVVNQSLRLAVREMVALFVVGSLLMLFTFFDIHNEIPSDDVLRGSLRNLGYITAAYTSYFVARQHGLRRAELLLVLAVISIPVFAYFLSIEYQQTYELVLRWEWGALAPAAVLYYLSAKKLRTVVLSAILISFGVIWMTIFDIRSFGAIFIGSGAIVLFSEFRRLSPRNKALFVVTGIFAVAFSSYVVYQQLDTTDEQVLDRREQSNRQRMEMALDAYDGIVASPVIGHGSWQHARTYIDSVFSTATVGVHSVIIQMAYEYGALGGLAAIAILWILVRALYFAVAHFRSYRSAPVVSVLFLVNGIYYIMMSPLGGPGRFVVGLTIGVAVAVLAERRHGESGAGYP